MLIPVDGLPREVDLPNGDGLRFMTSIRALIGTDCAERVWITDRWEAWLDENGGSAGKPVNQAATRLAQSFGWQLSLLGPVVIVGLGKNSDRPACPRIRPVPSSSRSRAHRDPAAGIRRGAPQALSGSRDPGVILFA